MLSINPWNILWTVVNLLVLYLIFKKLLFQPVMNVIHARDEMVKKQFESAKKSEEDAARMKTEYENKLRTAKAEADEIIQNARTREQEEHAIALQRARMESEHILEKAKADIVNEKEKAMQDAKIEVAQLAILAARKIIKTGDAHDTGSN